jgi:microsomal dipeptidase-like Zn-dependent dipeptidase
LQTDLEKSKAEEVSKLQAALHEMEKRIEEVTAMQERESAKKAVEEALAQEREKISLLTTEIEDLKVCSSLANFLFGNWTTKGLAVNFIDWITVNQLAQW